ncbi:MAG: DUF2726 domain-containing protein [Nitrospirales bacterium]
MNAGNLELLLSGITPELSLFSQLPSIAFPIILVLILVIIVLSIWFIWSRPSSPPNTTDIPIPPLPDNLTALPRPLFLSTEASIFNMVRLAVQDSYLVLAKLPLSSVLTIEEKDREVRKAMMKAIQPIRLDLALIHPGTFQLEKIIRFKTTEPTATLPPQKEELVSTILKSAGITMITLDLKTSYTVPQLLTLLGLAEED